MSDQFAGHTPGPWMIYTSNSYRRIGTRRGEYQVVCEAHLQRDGMPELYCRNAVDMTLLAAAPELLAERDAALAREQRLREALMQARDCVKWWADYASEYSRDKHDVDGDLARIDAALQEIK